MIGTDTVWKHTYQVEHSPLFGEKPSRMGTKREVEEFRSRESKANNRVGMQRARMADHARYGLFASVLQQAGVAGEFSAEVL